MIQMMSRNKQKYYHSINIGNMSQQITISIVNRSTLVPDTDILTMIVGINKLLTTFVLDWDLLSTHCILDIGIPKDGYAIYVVDTLETEVPVSESRPNGLITVKPILDNGGAMLTGAAYTVSQILSHEVFEMACDLAGEKWWQNAVFKSFAGEICDPVHGNQVSILVGTKTVSFSDWVVPKWIDKTMFNGPYNHLNTLAAPFMMEHNGMMVVLGEDGKLKQKFGEKVPQWVRTMVTTNGSRFHQRILAAQKMI